MSLSHEAQTATGSGDLIGCLERVCRETKTAYKDRRIVSDIMTHEVEALTLDHSVRAFLSFMQVNHVRHAPVIDYPNGRQGEAEFIGVISQRDVLRLGGPRMTGNIPPEPDPQALRQLLSRVITRGAQTIGPEETIRTAVERMRAHHIDMLPVLVGKRVTGIVTTTDLLRMIVRTAETITEACVRKTHQKDPAAWIACGDAEVVRLATFTTQTIEDIMARNVITMGPNQILMEAIETLKEHELRHVPIVDEENHIVGILSDRDILRQLPYQSKNRIKPSSKFREDLFRVDGARSALNLRIEQVMTSKLWTIEPSCKLVEAALILMKKKFGVLPVVDAERKILGIVSVVDMLSVVQGMVE